MGIVGQRVTKTVDTTNVFNHNTKHTNRRRTVPEISVINDGKSIKFGDSEEDAAQALTKLKNHNKVILTESDGWSCSIINISDIDNLILALQIAKEMWRPK